MNKVLFIFFLLLVLFSLGNKENTETVFQELTFNKMIYCIDVKDENVTTNNLNNIFKDIEIVSVYPYFNSSYKKLLLKDLDFVTLDEFNLYYRELLVKLGKYNWVSSYYEGIKLEKIKIYAYEYELNRILNSNKFIKICK